MKRFKNILVYLPDPSRDHQLLGWCRRIAECSDPESVELVHCVENFLPEFPNGPAMEEVLADEKTRLEQLAEAELPGREAGVSVTPEEPLKALLQKLAGGVYDLVILPVSDSGSRGFAERLARKSPVGVLIVPPGCLPTLKKILLAVDFSDLSPLALEWAEAFATVSPEDPDLDVLHVMKMPEGSRSMIAIEPGHLRNEIHSSSMTCLQQFLSEHSQDVSRWEPLVGEHPIANLQILRECRERGSDLVVIGSHGRSALSIGLLGGESAEIIREIACPLLVVKRKNQTLGFLRQLVGLDS